MSKFFIERPVLSNVIAIVTILLGAVCLYSLPVAQYPEIVPPTIQVTASYAGASAAVVANTVGIPIEQAVNGVEHSIYMESASGSDGSYTLTITFAVGSNLNNALVLVQNAVNSALPQLPQQVRAQGVQVRKVSTNILLIDSLYSTDNQYSSTFLSNYAIINLQAPLQRLPGVGQVSVLGGGPYSMRVWLDPAKLKTYGLTAADVERAIRNQNAQVAAGQVGGPPALPGQVNQFTINTLGRLSDASQFENIIIKATPPSAQSGQVEAPGPDQTSQIVRLKDVARVELSQQSYSTFSSLSGMKSAHIAIYALPGANALQVAAESRRLMAQMSKRFPEGLKYMTLFDTTKFINQSIHSVYETLFEAGVLVLLVIMLFLQNWRATLVPATTVPVTIIGAFAAMALLGFTVNLMTLFALILAIGIVVDDAIVIVENASHYIEQGLTPKDAAIKAMDELTGPVLGVTLVLTSVFLPASFLPGITGQMFRQFALVIAATAIISALNALTLKPTQCALYLRPARDKSVNWFYRGFNRGYQAVENAYIGVVSRIAHHPGTAACLFAIAVGAAGTLFMIYPTTLMPLEDQGYCIVVAELAPGASQPRVHKVANEIGRILKPVPGIKGWVTIGGYSALDRAKVSNVITTFVVYKDWAKRPSGFSQAHLLMNLQKRLKSIRQATFAVVPPSPIPGLGNAFGFQMMIEDRGAGNLRDLQTVTRDILTAAKDRPGFLRIGFTTFSADSPQISVDINRTMARSLGVPMSSVFQALQTYLGSSYVNLFNKYNQSFQVRVQASARYRRNPPDISNLYVVNRHGQMVPLGALVGIKRVLGSELITRFNLYPAATIIGVPDPRHYSSGQALDVMQRIGGGIMPRTMDYEWAALSYQEKLIGHQVIYIFALSLTLVFLVLAAQYESWNDPAAVLLTVPIALVGILVALVVRRFPVDLYTQIGLVLMIALAAKNAILIVEFARELKAKGMPATDAAVEATRRRFRPIVMTSLAFILGVVPLLTATGAGSASQRSLGTVVFGGMLASTLLAIPFVPVFYILMERVGSRFARHANPAVQTE